MGSHENCKRRLILWVFEDKLKKSVVQYVDLIRSYTHHHLEDTKVKAMRQALDLLRNKAEQEKAFLNMIVDKLGDPKYKIAAKALHMLNLLLNEHPRMQPIVIQEVRNLLQRPNVSPRSQYYCVCFLSTQILSVETKEVAQKLVKIYMQFFKAFTQKKIKKEDKMLSALLTGVSRAFPFADLAEKDVSEQMDLIFKTVHVTNLNTAIRALQLLYQVFNAREEVSDRYYNALYSTLLHTELPRSSTRHKMFLNLFYKSVKADPCENRVFAMIKRLMQICALCQSPFTISALVVVDQIKRDRPSLQYRFLTTASIHAVDGGDSGAGKIKVSADQLSKFGDDDEEEHFVDVAGESDVEEEKVEEGAEEKKKEAPVVKAAWVHKHAQAMRKGGVDGKAAVYNPMLRNPQYAQAEMTSLWELHCLRITFHPTVKLYAEKTLVKSQEDSAPLVENGDPLDDYTLIKFLDRFVYRNPKTANKKNEKRTSVHQHGKKNAKVVIPVNTPEFLQQTHLRPEEKFFHQYFQSCAKARGKPPVKKVKKEVEPLMMTSLKHSWQVNRDKNKSIRNSTFQNIFIRTSQRLKKKLMKNIMSETKMATMTFHLMMEICRICPMV